MTENATRSGDDIRVAEEVLALLNHRALELHRSQIGVLLPTERKLEGEQRVELEVRRQSEILPGDSIERPGEVLNDRSKREESKRSIRAVSNRRAIAGPSGRV